MQFFKAPCIRTTLYVGMGASLLLSPLSPSLSPLCPIDVPTVRGLEWRCPLSIVISRRFPVVVVGASLESLNASLDRT